MYLYGHTISCHKTEAMGVGRYVSEDRQPGVTNLSALTIATNMNS
jgi:hypothetical protein